MEKLFSQFVGQRCKLVKSDFFIMYGRLDGVDETGVLFTKDNGQKSYIFFDRIYEIIPKGDEQ